MTTASQKTPANAHTASTDNERPLTIAEAAEVLGIGRNQAYEAAHRGEIPVFRIGKRMLVPRVAFEHLLRGDSVLADLPPDRREATTASSD